MSAQINEICLKRDKGEALCFQGYLFSECSHFDEESGCLTRQQLYMTDKGEQVYYVVRSEGQKKERNAYRLIIKENSCIINNGTFEIEMPLDQLLLAIKGLCGITSEMMPSREEMEEILHAANS